ncbi:hypothetical protein FRC12_017502 [Ceratobasidium sp. 428]|nr:hypothetical protein FRC12_017502 [Ceratobasidium sp. 428]
MSQNGSKRAVQTDDEGLPPAIRQRTSLSTKKQSTKLPKKRSHGKGIPCHCPRHKGQLIRTDLWKRCQGNTRLKNLDKKIQAEILAGNQVWPVDHGLSKQRIGCQTSVAGPSALEPGATLSVPSYSNANNDAALYTAQQHDDGGCDDPSLPLLSGNLFDEGTNADNPKDGGDDNWDARAESPALDDHQSSSSDWPASTNSPDIPEYTAEAAALDEGEGYGPGEPVEERHHTTTPVVLPEDPRANLPDFLGANEAQPAGTSKERPTYQEFIKSYAVHLRTHCNLSEEHVETFLKAFEWATGPNGVLEPRS